MDLLKDDLSRENEKIQKKLNDGGELNQEELKILLLGLLFEEQLNENK